MQPETQQKHNYALRKHFESEADHSSPYPVTITPSEVNLAESSTF